MILRGVEGRSGLDVTQDCLDLREKHPIYVIIYGFNSAAKHNS